ncbi:HupE/UreJ family protein [Minwuia thermotolerans]|uniref:Hydrogenase n=1 Tax=Minwuia thermotolerans TaxID=2056226 RepID=A0A2M9G5Z3_9PROT|nr:HupE/UreJ family protein [Minwuia thermotolerans]PJK31133.1 hydrogenase [Minwuia thermotolerans]
MKFKSLNAGLGALILSMLAAAPALAHHPLGGATPETFFQGFLSGIGHPMIGFDHLAFIVAVGLAAAFSARRLLTPLAFVAATVAGCLLHVAGVMLPLPELLISASVVALGAVVLSGRTMAPALQIGFFAVAGLFHGFAYGSAIVGAETTPLLAYLVSFGLTQYVIALGAMALVTAVWKAAEPKALQPRLAGAVIAGVGLTFFLENVEGMILG